MSREVCLGPVSSFLAESAQMAAESAGSIFTYHHESGTGHGFCYMFATTLLLSSLCKLPF